MTTEQPKPRKLLDHVRDTLRVKHYSIRTEKTYVSWIRRYILFHDKRHPEETGWAAISLISHAVKLFGTDLAMWAVSL